MSCSLKTHNFERRIILRTPYRVVRLYRMFDEVMKEVFWEVYNLLPDQRDQLPYKGCVGQKAYNRFLKDVSFIDTHWAGHISETAKEMVSRAEKYQVRTYTYFNGVYLVCEPGKDTVESIIEQFHQKSLADAEKYERSFRYKLFEREMEEKRKDAERRQEIVEAWMGAEDMKVHFFKILKYRKVKKNISSKDSYVQRIISYAEEWAVAMQRAMRYEEGTQLSDIADEMSHFVDYDGITGYMYSCAASFIACFWKHGKEFRKWFNLHNQIDDEGERANKKRKAILNPAIIGVSVGGD